MNRLLLTAFCFSLLSIGCGGNSEKDKNPNPSLGEINTSPLPKRGEKGVHKTPGKGS